jgi:hypothetical protein
MPIYIDARQSDLRVALGMVGSAANDTLDTIFPKIDAEVGKLFEDRNILLTDGGILTFTGTQLQFTENLNLTLNSKISGAVPQVINLGSSNVNFVNSGDMMIAIINRIAGTAAVSVVTAGNPLPAVNSSNQEVFLIAKRVDAGDGTKRLYFRNGFCLNSGQTARLSAYNTGGGGGPTNPNDSVVSQATRINATLTTGTPASGTFYSSILNRSSMPDLTQNLQAQMGVNRIVVSAVYGLVAETNSLAQQVWAMQGDKTNSIRFVGNACKFQSADATGTRINLGVTTPYATNIINDYVEITFYGTGLNMLAYIDNNNRVATASVDGGSFGSNIYPSNGATAILSLGFNQNCVLPVVAGLTLGVHTVTIKNGSIYGTGIEGFEILNESGNVIVNPGISFVNGTQLTNGSQSSFAYNSMASGTTGGRVLVYQSAGGSISSAFTPVAASPSYLGSANHTNEEAAKKVAWREFGSGATTGDFAQINNFSQQKYVMDTASDFLALTVQGGYSTSYVQSSGDWNPQYPEALVPGFIDSNASITYTFVGCGLDITLNVGNLTTTITNWQFIIDGGSTQNIPLTPLTGQYAIVPIVSGLPYGSHTITFLGAPSDYMYAGISFFHVYQPKTPALPIGAIQLASYNIMANYVANSISGQEQVSQGILRKASLRETILTSTNWTWGGMDDTYASGYKVSSGNTADAYFTFFGTGIEWTHNMAASNILVNVSIDGNSNLSSFTTSLVQPGTGRTFTAATGVYTGTSSLSGEGKIQISGLSLGVHTIHLNYPSAVADAITLDCWDVITPIHSYNSESYAQGLINAQVGSQGIEDDRNLESLTAAAAEDNWVEAIVDNQPTPGTASTSATAFVPMPGLSKVIKTNGGDIKVFYSISIENTCYAQIYIDGQPVGNSKESVVSFNTMSDMVRIPASAGTHTVAVYWMGSCQVAERNMIIEEV